MVPFLAIFGAALSGYADIGPWCIALAAFALFCVSRADNAELYRRPSDHVAAAATSLTAIRSSANAIVATSGAYCLGIVIRLV